MARKECTTNGTICEDSAQRGVKRKVFEDEWEEEKYTVIGKNGKRFKKDSRVWLHKSSTERDRSLSTDDGYTENDAHQQISHDIPAAYSTPSIQSSHTCNCLRQRFLQLRELSGVCSDVSIYQRFDKTMMMTPADAAGTGLTTITIASSEKDTSVNLRRDFLSSDTDTSQSLSNGSETKIDRMNFTDRLVRSQSISPWITEPYAPNNAITSSCHTSLTADSSGSQQWLMVSLTDLGRTAHRITETKCLGADNDEEDDETGEVEDEENRSITVFTSQSAPNIAINMDLYGRET